MMLRRATDIKPTGLLPPRAAQWLTLWGPKILICALLILMAYAIADINGAMP